MNHRLILSLLLLAGSAPALAQTGGAAPRPLTRAAFLQNIDRAFAAADANKDGFADQAELAADHQRQAAQRKAQALRQREAAFRRLDSNKNGSLSLQEFNALAAAAPAPQADAARLVARFDSNKDGRVSSAENRAPALAGFDRADSNRDGLLSPQEQRARRP